MDEQKEMQHLIREILKRERNREWDKTSFYLREVSPSFLQRFLDVHQGSRIVELSPFSLTETKCFSIAYLPLLRTMLFLSPNFQPIRRPLPMERITKIAEGPNHANKYIDPVAAETKSAIIEIPFKNNSTASINSLDTFSPIEAPLPNITFSHRIIFHLCRTQI